VNYISCKSGNERSRKSTRVRWKNISQRMSRMIGICVDWYRRSNVLEGLCKMIRDEESVERLEVGGNGIKTCVRFDEYVKL